jgi:hypothetical protein
LKLKLFIFRVEIATTKSTVRRLSGKEPANEIYCFIDIAGK